jgi:hypothetical protein
VEGSSPEAILKILDQAGVKRALVSSTPDDGTLRLWPHGVMSHGPDLMDDSEGTLTAALGARDGEGIAER